MRPHPTPRIARLALALVVLTSFFGEVRAQSPDVEEPSDREVAGPVDAGPVDDRRHAELRSALWWKRDAYKTMELYASAWRTRSRGGTNDDAAVQEPPLATDARAKIIAGRRAFISHVESLLTAYAKKAAKGKAPPAPSGRVVEAAKAWRGDSRPALSWLLVSLYLDQSGSYRDQMQYLEQRSRQAESRARISKLRRRRAVVRGRAAEEMQRLVDGFPAYPKLADVLDAQARLEASLGNNRAAKRALQRLLCRDREQSKPLDDSRLLAKNNTFEGRLYRRVAALKSYDDCQPTLTNRLVQDERWMQLAELHGRTKGEAQLAISSYGRVLRNPNSYLYLDALQEVASIYEEVEDYGGAIAALDQLVEYIDDDTRDADERDLAGSGTELRRQAIAKIARLFVAIWEVHRRPEANAVVDLAKITYARSRRYQVHAREVLMELGEELLASRAYAQSEPVWHYILELWPTHADVPAIYDALIRLADSRGSKLQAERTRRGLLSLTDTKSSWYRANASKPDVLASARTLVERIWYSYAIDQYHAVEEAVDSEKRVQRDKLWAGVEKILREFTRRFPQSSRRYEILNRLSETLVNQRKWQDAAEISEKVRNGVARDTHVYARATRTSASSLRSAIDVEVGANRLARPKTPTVDELRSAKAVELPALYRRRQVALDRYAEIQDQNYERSRALYQSATIDLNFRRVRMARHRYEALLSGNLCNTYYARRAKRQLVNIYIARDSMSRGDAQKAVDARCNLSPAEQERRRKLLETTVAGAQRLAGRGKYVEAARSYYAAFRLTDPKDKLHAETLFRAATQMRAAGKTEAALSLLSRFKYVSTLKNTVWAVDALKAQAELYALAHDYRRSGDMWRRVVTKARDPKALMHAGVDRASEARRALWFAAQAREMSREFHDRENYPGAASLYLQYASQSTDNIDAAVAMARAARVYGLSGASERLKSLTTAWRKHPASKVDDLRIYGLFISYQHAKLLDSEGYRKQSLVEMREVVKLWDQLPSAQREPVVTIRGTGRVTIQPNQIAGFAQFKLAEHIRLAKFVPYRARWPEVATPDNLEQSFKELQSIGVELFRAYEKVGRFDSKWSIAAKSRLGDVIWGLLDKLLSAPPPRSWRKDNGKVLRDAKAIAKAIREQFKMGFSMAEEFWREAVKEAKLQNRPDDEWAAHAERSIHIHIDGSQRVNRREIILLEDSP